MGFKWYMYKMTRENLWDKWTTQIWTSYKIKETTKSLGVQKGVFQFTTWAKILIGFIKDPVCFLFVLLVFSTRLLSLEAILITLLDVLKCFLFVGSLHYCTYVFHKRVNINTLLFMNTPHNSIGRVKERLNGISLFVVYTFIVRDIKITPSHIWSHAIRNLNHFWQPVFTLLQFSFNQFSIFVVDKQCKRRQFTRSCNWSERIHGTFHTFLLKKYVLTVWDLLI